MMRKLARVAVLLAAAAAVFAPGQVAGAEPPQDQQDVIRIPDGQTSCPEGYVCVFRDFDYRGGGYGFRAPMQVSSLYVYSFNDMMSSWANDSGVRYCWYTDVDFQGTPHVMNNRYRVNVLSSENDMASSLRPC